ncbi:hypothetical protein SAMN05445756_0505 [Kytococcus aerolatus]|uniref:F0F1-ATPase subunit Ca2+/Mg2+ transporter n=1 Tax=Kytococcus aerolatus TaxID=592308 RepID=A0A212T667_9MICO|nr:AtpZ/AtpI family protein [Kytococcus aerolatus]SNC61553.1 hypothetical protein SAMN05445756_0505 [Kytococcus aerolatus]
MAGPDDRRHDGPGRDDTRDTPTTAPYKGPWVGDDQPEDPAEAELWRRGGSAGSDLGAAVLGTLLTSILAFAALGWFAAELTGWEWLTAVCVLLGVGMSLWVVILRYGDP